VFEPKVDSKNAGQKKKKPRPSQQKGGAFYSKTSGIGQLKREHSFKFIDSKGHGNRPTTQGGTENTKCSGIETIWRLSMPYYQP
jgi:hypothetical protein